MTLQLITGVAQRTRLAAHVHPVVGHILHGNVGVVLISLGVLQGALGIRFAGVGWNEQAMIYYAVPAVILWLVFVLVVAEERIMMPGRLAPDLRGIPLRDLASRRRAGGRAALAQRQ